MAHPRRIRRTTGNLLRFEVEYSVRTSVSVESHAIEGYGGILVVTCIASTYRYLPPGNSGIDVQEVEICDRPRNLYDVIENVRRRAVYELAGRVNIALDLEPRAEEGVPWA